jgi:hypothetical protein
VEFIESRAFSRRLREFAANLEMDVLRSIQLDLIDNPERGARVKGLLIRKARAGNPARGKGKRGGFRYLYLHLRKVAHIHLLLILDKNEQDDLSEDQRRFLKRLTAEFGAE